MRPFDADRARDTAAAMLGCDVDAVPLPRRGRNSRIYRIIAGGKGYALKHYPSIGDDRRDRLATEMAALTLMAAQGVDNIPRVVAADRGQNALLLSWLDGVAPGEITDADIDAALAFLRAVHALREAPEAAALALASEACLSGSEIERQLSARLARLRAFAAEEPELAAFLNSSFEPTSVRCLAVAKGAAAAAGIDFSADVPQEWRTLVPADFGFHNALRRNDRSLVFMDFEYFGWDDPVKLTADTLLHPSTALAPVQQLRFRQGADALYSADATFAARLAAYLPLFALRWSLILLNEFDPEKWQTRVAAGMTGDWAQVKARQLISARAMLSLARPGLRS